MFVSFFVLFLNFWSLAELSLSFDSRLKEAESEPRMRAETNKGGVCCFAESSKLPYCYWLSWDYWDFKTSDSPKKINVNKELRVRLFFFRSKTREVGIEELKMKNMSAKSIQFMSLEERVTHLEFSNFREKRRSIRFWRKIFFGKEWV